MDDPWANPNCPRCEGTGWYHPFAPDDTFGPEEICPCVFSAWDEGNEDDEDFAE